MTASPTLRRRAVPASGDWPSHVPPLLQRLYAARGIASAEQAELKHLGDGKLSLDSLLDPAPHPQQAAVGTRVLEIDSCFLPELEQAIFTINRTAVGNLLAK